MANQKGAASQPVGQSEHVSMVENSGLQQKSSTMFLGALGRPVAQKKQESMVEHCGPQAESSPEVRNAEETTPENTECQEPFDNLELEDDMYNLAEHLEN